MKKKTALLLLQYAIFFGLGFALIYWQYTTLSPENIAELKEALGQFRERYWIIFPVILIGFFSHFIRALRWRLMLEPLNIFPTVVNITGAVLIGYLTNLLIPRMGEVAKCTVLARYENEPADKVIGTIVAERAFDLICLALICVLTFFIQAEVIGTYLAHIGKEFTTQKNVPLLVTLGIVGLILFVLLLRWIYKKNKSNKVGKFIKGMGEGLRAIMMMKQRVKFIIYTILLWAGYLSLIYIGFQSIEATEHLGIGPALMVLIVGSIGMIVTPGGIGAYPPAVQLALRMLYGVKGSFGLAFGWISWLAQTLIVIVFGLIALLILPLYNRNRNGQIAVDQK
jgi:glycosyltransferase 2 family protein